MPPGRKKGASKADNVPKLSVGDLVLAKVKGFPAWPAKIGRAEDWEREPDPKKVFVHFFGTEEIAFVAPADVQVFNVEARKSLLARLQGKSVKFFAKAVREICDAYDKLKSQDPFGLKEHGSRTKDIPLEANVNAQREDACAVDGSRDHDYLVDSTMEPQVLQVRGYESVTDRFMAKLDETSTLVRSDLSCPANGNVSSSMSLKQKNYASNSAHSLTKITSAEVSNCHASLAEDIKNQQNIVTLMKATDQPNLASFNDSRIKKLEHETNGFEGVSDSKIVDSIIGLKTNQEADMDDLDLRRTVTVPLGVNELKKTSVAESSSAALKMDSGASDVKKNDSLVKSKKVLKVESKADVSKNQMGNVITGRKRKLQLVNKMANVADNELTFPDSVKSKGINSDESGKKPSVKRQKISPSKVTGVKKGKHTGSKLREEALSAPEFDNMETVNSNVESALSVAKECILALEASSTYLRTSVKKPMEMPTVDVLPLSNPKSLGNASTVDVLPSTNPKLLGDTSRVKRRAVCLVDDVEERPRTPVYRGFKEKVKAITPIVGSIAKRDAVKDRSKASQIRKEDCTKSEAMPLGRCSKSSKDTVKIESKRNASLPLSTPPREKAFDTPIDLKGEQVYGSSQVHQASDAQKIADTHKGTKMSNKNISRAEQKKTPVADSGSQWDGMSHVENVTPKRKSTPGDGPNFTSKVRPKMNHAAVDTSSEKKSSFVGIERVDMDDPSCVLRESRMSDSDTSMKLLIAAAQAKRMAARSQSASHPVSCMFDPIGIAFPKNSSPGLEDLRHANNTAAIASPSVLVSQFPSEPQIRTEGLVSSGHPSNKGSLSSGTDAAVARDAFEGMIETLSRTKESIGRATRLAIDCAKYGIANEVVELLIRKLENEPNMHHRVDLFFLVDSIMQCSHNQKGIAGASYAPAVEGALPRLLSAAAPSGSGARENRRQCLKVLRLWLERKILPSSVLRRYMDDIGVSNGDASGIMSFKRPSRAERSVDDPIREMEGMLVDEYGSNATMQLPSFLTSRIFEDEEEEDDHPSIPTKISDEAPVSDGNQEIHATFSSNVTSSILKSVNGELEMEDFDRQRKDNYSSCALAEGSQQRVLASGCDEKTTKHSSEFPPLATLPIALSSPSPPLPSSPAPSPPPPPPQQYPSPPQSPPPPPPPHSSPPPPLPQSPPPPSSPPPPPPSSPPPPMPSHPQSFASHPPPLPSHAPSHQVQASFTPMAPPSIQLAGHTRPMFMPPMQSQYAVSPHSSLNSKPLPTPQPHPSELAYQNCVPGNPPGEIYPTPIRPNAIHGQYGPPLPAVAVPAPPPQPLSSHFSYANSVVHQRSYHAPYGLHPPESNRPYGTDSQFPQNPLNMWTNGGTALPPSQPIVQEGYYQPVCQRPTTNNPGFQHPSNGIPSGVPVPGHGAVHIWPRPDIAASNCWRPT